MGNLAPPSRLLPAPHVGFHLFFFLLSLSLPTVRNEMERSLRMFVRSLKRGRKYCISSSKNSSILFLFHQYTRSRSEKEELEEGINSSLFLSRLKSNIFFFFFLKEKANIIHLSCLEKFIIKPCFKTVRDDE